MKVVVFSDDDGYMVAISLDARAKIYNLLYKETATACSYFSELRSDEGISEATLAAVLGLQEDVFISEILGPYLQRGRFAVVDIVV